MKFQTISVVRRGTILIVAIILAFLGSTDSVLANSCIDCHSVINKDITETISKDIHSSAGLSCADCHGGNPEIEDEGAMDPKYGYIGAPDKLKIPQFCGKCHSDPSFMHNYNPLLPTDQLEKYWTSTHGRELKKGDKMVATCASCHTTHSILPANDPRSSVYPENVPKTCATCHANEGLMKRYGLLANQYAQYIDTLNVHGNALLVENDISSPACNDCHGNHGAAPPGFENVAMVCTQCHALNGRFFLQSPHLDGFEAMEVDQCAFCHQKNPSIDEPAARIHTIVSPDRHLVGTNEGAVCIQCHEEGDKGWVTAGSISDLLDSLDNRFTRAEHLIESVEEKGLEVSDARWSLESEVLHARMELRTSIHHFNLVEYGLHYLKADTSMNMVLEAGSMAMKEFGGRRVYYLLVTVLLAMFIAALYGKMKDMEKDRD